MDNVADRYDHKLFHYKRIFFPINIKNLHWCLVVCECKDGSDVFTHITCYDSWHKDYPCGKIWVKTVQKYIETMWIRFGGEEISEKHWNLDYQCKDMPQQEFGSNDCAVFVCLAAHHLSQGNEINDLNGNLVTERGRLHIQKCLNRDSIEE